MDQKGNIYKLGKMTKEDYEFIISTINKNDVKNAIDFLEAAIVDERDVLYLRHSIAALKFLLEILL